MIHTVFVSKYWTLSKQLESILNRSTTSDGGKINLKVSLILTLQVTVCLASVVILLVWPRQSDNWSASYTTYFVACILPPFVVCIVLYDALIRIRKCELLKNTK